MDFNKLRHITTFVLDVDGVLTDSRVLVTESGELLRTMNTRDGQAIKYALEQGYRLAIFTKGKSKGVKLRLQGLGIEDIIDGLEEKRSAFQKYINENGIKKDQILYMGDDIPDLKVFDLAGIRACPNDATHEVIKQADFISSLKGGDGCVREIIEKVMRIQGKWIS